MPKRSIRDEIAKHHVVFYDNNLLLPMLNVVLVRQSWKEVPPGTQAWN